MKEIRICSMDSDRVVLEAIMEGVNGLIRAKLAESAPSAAPNMPSAPCQNHGRTGIRLVTKVVCADCGEPVDRVSVTAHVG